MGKKFKDLAAGILIGVLLSVGIYMVPQAVGADWAKGLPFTTQQLAIIKQVKLALETYQVDGDKAGKIDEKKMYYGAVKGMVESVGDPFTRFVDPKMLEDFGAKMSALLANTPASDIEKNAKAMLSGFFGKLDLVTREEFDVQAQVLARTREKPQALEARVDALEKARSGQ